MPKKFLEAGKIVGTHGIRGDLKVQSWCDTPEVLCDFDTLYLDEKTPVEVKSAQVHKNVVLMHLKGVDTVEAAEKLRGKILHLDRDDVDLPEDLVFIQDILTFKVYDLRVDRVIGHIRDVLTSNPAHDMYEIAGEDGRLIYIPAIKPFLKEMINAVMRESIIGRAQDKGIVEVKATNIRDYALDKHHKADDAPYGGGRGQVMLAEPLYLCHEALSGGEHVHTVFLSAQGAPFNQEKARELLAKEHFILVCGHYEGIDQRFIDECVDEEISIGDFVLTGGEIPAMAVADAVCRMVPGVLPDEEAFTAESHWDGLLEHPQYTRPENWRGREVPEVLLSGHHANIEAWRREMSLRRTKKDRPDLFAKFEPQDKRDRKILEKIRQDG